MANGVLVSKEEMQCLVDTISAHKVQPVGAMYLAERLGKDTSRISVIANACKRSGVPILQTAMRDGNNKTGYTLGGDIKLLEQVKIGDDVEVFASHYEDTDDFPKYWKRFTIIAETPFYFVIKSKNGVTTTLLKVDMFNGSVKACE